jgi:hypothetical protein
MACAYVRCDQEDPEQDAERDTEAMEELVVRHVNRSNARSAVGWL